LGLLAVSMAACAQAGAATPPPPRHVFLIVMENKSPQQALQGSFTASLAARYRVAGNYTAIAHPSLPNYLALSSGQTWGVEDDNYHMLPRGGIGDQLTAAGVGWRAYMEGMTAGQCKNSQYPYYFRHNPFAYYGGNCPDNVVPFTSLADDLSSSKPPMFSWISPDGCNDTHDCRLSVGDDWLRQTVGLITQSKAWSANGVLFVVWDEDDHTANNRVLSLVISPHQGHKVSDQPYTHYSLLATIEDLLRVGRLGNAAQAKAMTDLVG
jgi:phosphatidylinositol-3-phosphatase